MPATKKEASFSRREFLEMAGLAAGGAVLAFGAPAMVSAAQRISASADTLPEHPNLLFIVTDQERVPQHWPQGWDFAVNLPARQKLLEHGLSFQRAFCNSSMCSPSRANLITGLYPMQHGLIRTLTYAETLSNTEVPLGTHIPNMARMLAAAGYYVALKGKWHLSKDKDGNPPTVDNLLEFGFHDWDATIAGEATDVDAFGGGCAQNDAEIVDSAIAWLNQADRPEPFALFVMLANPHDVLAYPDLIDDDGDCPTTYKTTINYEWGINPPPTFTEDLSTNRKPTVQNASLALYNMVLGSLSTALQRNRYVNFYAYLHTLVDAQIDRLLIRLDELGLTNSTIIVRTADHGEMGLSHGGLRQKMFNAYEETMRVPLIFSNPLLFPTPRTTNALASLVDISPTIATLANVPNKANHLFMGVDLSPIIYDTVASVQDTILFTFDDDRCGTGSSPEFLVQTPMAHHIRCIRTDIDGKEWKYARYFNPPGENAAAPEYELYDLTSDPTEYTNQHDQAGCETIETTLEGKLAQVEAERLNPLSFEYLPASFNS